MKEKKLDKENLEDLERNEDLTSKSGDFADDDVVFEDLDSDGEILTEKQKSKNDKEKLKEKFEDKIKRLEKERDEYLAGWQRIQADYKNREREIEDYKKEIIKFANTNIIRDLIPVLDGYDIAKSNKSQWEAIDTNWRMGVEYLFAQLHNVLESNGVNMFGEVGEEYDTSLHEAVEKIKLPLEEKEKSGKIINVLQKGYRIGDKILREARVKVGYFEE